MVAIQAPVELSFEVNNFTGLNIDASEARVGDDDLTDLVNFDTNPSGELTTRGGFTNVSAGLISGIPAGLGYIRLIGHYYTNTISQILATNGSDFLVSGDGAQSWQVYSGVGKITFGVQYRDLFYMTRYDDVMCYWNGTAITGIPSSPAGTACVVFHNRMFVLHYQGNTSIGNNANYIYFCAQNQLAAIPFLTADWTNPDDAGNFPVNPGDGDVLVGFAVLQDTLFLFKTHSMWRFNPVGALEDWVLRDVSMTVGCTSVYTIREIEGYIWFASEQAVYKTDGVTFLEMSRSIRPIFKGHFPAGGVNSVDTVNLDSAAYWNGKFFYHIVTNPMGQIGYTRNLYVLDVQSNGWTRYDIAPYFSGKFTPMNMLEVDNPNTGTYVQRGLYMGDSTANKYVWRWGGSVDLTHYYDTSGPLNTVPQPYNATMTTKAYDLEDISRAKRTKWVELEASYNGNMPNAPTAVTVTQTSGTVRNTNTGHTNSRTDTVSWPVWQTGRDFYTVRGLGFFETMRFTVTHQNDAQAMIIYSIRMRFTKTDRRLAGK